MPYLEYLSLVFLASFAGSFILLFADRVGLTEWLQVNGNDFVHELASCRFCLSFWCSVLVSSVLVLLFGWVFLFAPVFTTPLIYYFQQ